jgi:4-hydroxy-tetrahydrodipicolinate reductase
LVGRELGEVAGLPGAEVTIVSSLDEVEAAADVAFHATGSSLQGVADDLQHCLRLGLNVVSSCEELSYPFRTNAAIAEALDLAAMDAGVTVLGSGVNPGYAMDTLVLAASVPCWEIRAVSVRRVVDPLTRRQSFQDKVGLGLSPDGFGARRASGTIGHVGLTESAWFVCDRLRLDAVRVDETLDPIIAKAAIKDGESTIHAGEVAGFSHVATATGPSGEVTRLELHVSAGARDTSDTIRLDSEPPIELVVPGGVPGDDATAAVIVNASPRVVAAQSGLVTMADILLPHAERMGAPSNTSTDTERIVR